MRHKVGKGVKLKLVKLSEDNAHWHSDLEVGAHPQYHRFVLTNDAQELKPTRLHSFPPF